MYERNCPQCEKKLEYSNLKNRNQAERKKVLCKECVFLNKKLQTLITKKQYNHKRLTDEQVEYIKNNWDNQELAWEYVKSGIENKRKIAEVIKNTPFWERVCPICGDVIKHTNKQNRNNLERKKTPCTKCAHKIFGENHKGKNNTFFGKKHSKESMEQMKESSLNSEKRQKYYEKIRTQEHRDNMSEKFSGENNPRYGRGGLYDIWLEKYGEEEAKIRYDSYINKVSETMKGEKAFWFGKTPPHGVGNGYNGWYNNWFFRSIHELSYMINVIEKENLEWISAENQEYKVSYVDETGEKRNYFADFLIQKNTLIEVKPTSLQETKNVLLKSEAAKKFCKNKGLRYEIVDPIKLTDEEIMDLYVDGKIIFTEKTEQKFKDKYLNN